MSPRTSALVVMLVAALAYANALGGSFVGDDRQLVLENPAVRSLKNVPAMLGLETGVPEARALRNASYALDWFVGNGSPVAFHVTNLLLHALATGLVFAVARRVMPRAALASALLFALHPAHTESVAWIAGRKDVLATVFVLAGFLSFLRWRERGGNRWLAWLAAAFVAGVLSKEVACVLPVLCLAYDASVGGWRAIRTRWLLYAIGGAIALVVVAAVLFEWRVSAVAGAGGFHWVAGTLAKSAPTIARVVSRYLVLLVLPVRLVADYSFDAFPISSSWSDPFAIAGLALVVFAFVAGVVVWRRNRSLGFAMAWIGLALAPVAQIIPHHELLSEHDLYLPSVGICWVGGWFFSTRAARPFLVTTCVLFALLVIRRNGEWRDERSILESTVRVAPRCARAQFNLARLDGERGDAESMRLRLLAVDAIGPGPDAMASRAFVAAENEIVVQALRGGATGAAEAESRLRRAIAAMPQDAGSRLNLASVLGSQGRVADAATVLEDGVRRGIDDATVTRTLARARGELGLPAADVLAPLAASLRAARRDVDRDAGVALLLLQLDRSHDDGLRLLAYRALGRSAEASECRRRIVADVRGGVDLVPNRAGARKRALEVARRDSNGCALLDLPGALDSVSMKRALGHLRAHVILAIAAERESWREATAAGDPWRLVDTDFRRLFGELR
ncbi:MAG: glycosyltransferase family 39 protein [Planctomycetes bacterium]|nr:glycosyltransferase family 39 protein [Planctomycetota bacterium]MBI3847057.1 glycosyltransferase family 39 protein [Planctomycetota bacterium]